MSDAAKTASPMTNRLLAIAVILAMGGGAGTYFFYTRYEDARIALEDAHENYDDMLKRARHAHQIWKSIQETKTEDSQGDPATAILKEFHDRGFPSVQVDPPPRANTIGNWKELVFRAHFPRRRRDFTISRGRYLDTLRAIEKKRPDLKTKNLSFSYVVNDYKTADVVFVRYDR